MDHPVPRGYSNSAQDFTIIRTFDGQKATGKDSGPPSNWKNERSTDDADIGEY